MPTLDEIRAKLIEGQNNPMSSYNIGEYTSKRARCKTHAHVATHVSGVKHDSGMHIGVIAVDHDFDKQAEFIKELKSRVPNVMVWHEDDASYKGDTFKIALRRTTQTYVDFMLETVAVFSLPSHPRNVFYFLAPTTSDMLLLKLATDVYCNREVSSSAFEWVVTMYHDQGAGINLDSDDRRLFRGIQDCRAATRFAESEIHDDELLGIALRRIFNLSGEAGKLVRKEYKEVKNG